MTSEAGEGASLCPQCLALIPARYEQEDSRVFQVKHCPEHGGFRTLVWWGPPDFASWQRPKIPASLAYTERPVERGCPFDCGLCPEHRQRTCTAVLDVAQGCDLGCPVCYADSPLSGSPVPSLELIRDWLHNLQRGGGGNIQLSGGEPTTRDDLPAVVALCRDTGFDFVQLNTNGLRLAVDRAFAESLVRAGLASVFLQFDAVDDAAYTKLRGRPLLGVKLAALETCRELGLGVVLVPTLARGVNLDQVGPILALAQERSPTVRAVHFQPMSRFGRYPPSLRESEPLTLPELMRAIDEQSKGRFPLGSFRPPGCENSLCSFQGNFLLHDDGRMQPLSQGHDTRCCPTPEPAEQGARRTISRVSRQWTAPPAPDDGGPPPPAASPEAPIALDAFITLARQRTLSVSAMAFQDVWNLDLERVRDCCIHQVAPDGRRVPFCLYNLTSASGQRLYRS